MSTKLRAENPTAPVPGRSGHDVGQRARPGHHAGRRAVPGAARGQGARAVRGRRCGSWSRTTPKAALLGIIGEPHVNVLKLNLALDAHAELRPNASCRRDRDRRNCAPGDAGHDRRATDRDNRPSPEALLKQAAQEKGAAGSRFSSAPRPASARPTRCWQARAGARLDGVDVVVGVVETHGGVETEPLQGLRDHSAKAHRLSRARCWRKWISTPSCSAARARAGRRARAHQCARQPPSQALLDVEELLDRRHRRLHHAQRPASSKASTTWWRRSRACACARRCPIRSSTAPTKSSWSI